MPCPEDSERDRASGRFGEAKPGGPSASDLVNQWHRKIESLPKATQTGDADEQLSAILVPPLWTLYHAEDTQIIARIGRFYRSHRRQLNFVHEHHADDPRVAPLLKQPELPLILDLLEADPTGLQRAWPVVVPRTWLDALADAWGRPL